MDVRFGEFEFSFKTMRLRKNGANLRLVGQPLRLLMMLLESPGTVVSREEIRQRLWPDTHVGFDHSVDSALNRLRAVLGDSGRQPRFIETIPAVGYRFLATVEPVATLAAAPRGRRGVLVMWFVVTALLAALLALAIVHQHYDRFVPRSSQTGR